ncbi:MAG TPA: flagellar hook-associated protein FlgK [Tepidisphaeraceae bacterium]|jgi:flagellar hook-associated protein 1 FlgK|nr:flagellar hook-associated protein FlgK [Tepidisphaeraceae bacterium]
MSLIGALNSAKTALAVQQAAIQVTGNNISNAGNADYTRQTANLAPSKDQQLRPGVFLGTGVDLTSVQRQIDDALEGRLRASNSDAEAADTTQQWLGRVESLFNELSDEDLSTQLSTFFNSWSNLANKPQDIGLRQVVIQNGDGVAKWFQNLRSQLGSLGSDVDDRTKALAGDADQLARQIADLNGQITIAEGGAGGQANGLRDQRDAVLKQLSQLVDVKTVEDQGVVNIYVGSQPIVMGTQNRGIGIRTEVGADGKLTTNVVCKANNGALQLTSGQLGALTQVKTQLAGVTDKVDTLASNLIFELNKLHASGQGLEGFSSVSSTNLVDDPAKALSDPKSGLDFTPNNGSFVVHVKNKTTGLTTSTLVQVDLDGLNGNDTTLNSLATDIDNVTNISASVAGGQMKISADSPDVEISFSQDSSGVLAALGINNFYNGTDARDIAVSNTIKDRPALLAAAKNGEPADNQTARGIADLEQQSVKSLDGSTLKATYESMVNGVGTAAAAAKTNSEATQVVKQTLEAQREALSGVSLDEEAVNLMREQRAFQGAARLITAVNEMMDTVLNLVH